MPRKGVNTEAKTPKTASTEAVVNRDSKKRVDIKNQTCSMHGV